MKYRKEIAKAYFNFLMSIDWNDDFYVQGVLDARKHFLTNAVIGTSDDVICFNGVDYKLSALKKKYFCGDYFSLTAVHELERSLVEKRNPKELVFEHMVPKKRYIQEACEKEAKRGKLTVEFIEDRLQRLWKIAIITKEEDKRLHRDSMPVNWDGIDVLGRYKTASLTLIERKDLSNSHWLSKKTN